VPERRRGASGIRRNSDRIGWDGLINRFEFGRKTSLLGKDRLAPRLLYMEA